jgi:tyrosyl-tRNA synthetase
MQDNDTMTRLSESVAAASALLAGADLAADPAVRELLELTGARRRMDLTDLPPAEQAALIAERSQQLQPSPDALAARITGAGTGNPFIAKFGIDPTGAKVHLGHAVPMQILSRFQRMGHQVVFIVGDVTAKIGDPSGRSDERPALTDADIARNLATYREQVSPSSTSAGHSFATTEIGCAASRCPGSSITAQIPLSMPLQREDFRTRLEAGTGLSVAELLYSVVMALDSVEVGCDLEVGGIDQLLNMQMCRRVMEICGQTPEVVVATPLIEGTDGTGAKMSKSRQNYIPVGAPPGELFGMLMSIPDRLVPPYLRALSEWRDAEVAITDRRLVAGSLHPMDLKKILAGDVTAANHGVDAAMKAREEFAARFSRRTFAEIADLPTITDLDRSIVETVRALGFAKSNGEVRRVAEQRGLRLVGETDHGQDQLVLTPDEAREPLAALVDRVSGDRYLKVGRKLARIVAGA